MSYLLLATQAIAAESWIIATQNEKLNLNKTLSLIVIKPSDAKIWPEKLSLTISSQDASEIIELIATIKQDNARRYYAGKVTSDFQGDVLAKLTHQPSNRLLMTVNRIHKAPHPIAISQPEQSPQVAAIKQVKKTEPILIPEPKIARTISANEPLYFIVGTSKQRSADARFQISFKYRAFDPDASVATFIPYASHLYFAYTQTSIWDLGGESSPFKDTSYRPSVYYNWAESGQGLKPNNWKFGLEHESNGRGGDNSRSMNIAFVQPFWNTNYLDGKRFTFMPKIYTYLEKSDNQDMPHYRGYVDWLARYGRDDGGMLTAMYRQGTRGYAQGQLDFSYPISDKIFGRTGTFLHFQLLSGYGETLIDYNKKSNTQLRVGISLTR